MIKAIRINNIIEWVEIQNFLFNLGWGWESSCKKVIYIKDYNHNYSNILIILNHEKSSMSWSFESAPFENKLIFQIENAETIIRREKLKKLSK